MAQKKTLTELRMENAELRQSRDVLVKDLDTTKKVLHDALEKISILQENNLAEKRMGVSKEEERQRLSSALQARDLAYEKADRRADQNDAARTALLEAMYRLGQGMGEK